MMSAMTRMQIDRGMGWLWPNFLIIGPKKLCCVIHVWNLGEDFAKQLAASKIKGVVGSRGKTTPITPKPTHVQPISVSDIFLIFNFINLAVP